MKTPDSLRQLRDRIDALDADLVRLLFERQKTVEEVLIVKRTSNIPARIESRIDDVISNAQRNAVEIGLNPDLAGTVWRAMVEWFVRHEEEQLRRE